VHPGFVCDAAFQDIGTPDDYWTTSFECLAARPPEEGVRAQDPHRHRRA
jgi:hypothetical protein